MAFTIPQFGMGGESQEPLLDIGSAGAAVSLSNAVAITGARVYALDATGVNDYHIAAGQGYSTTHIRIFYFGINTPAPSAAFPLLYDASGGSPVLEVGTDRKIRLYNSASVLVAGPSAAIPANTATWGCLVIDPLSLSTSHVWATLYLGGTVQFSLDIGTPGWATSSWHWGQISGPNCGITVYLDDMVPRFSAAASDSPDLVAYPRLRVDTAFPNADTSDDDWFLKAGSAGSADFGQWDELGGHDGDGTYNHTATISDLQLSEFEDAAQLGWGANALPYHAALLWVEKTVGGSKFFGRGTCRLNGTYTVQSWDTAGPGGAYERGAWVPISRPGGGAWTRADLANLKAGLETNSAAHDEDWRVTLLVTIWVYEDDTTDRLPLATTPSLPAVGAGPVASPTLMGQSVGIF